MRVRKKFAVVFILCMILASLTTVQAAESPHPWPNQGNDLQNSKRSMYDTSNIDGTILWTFESGIPNLGGYIGYSYVNGPVVNDEGTIYFGAGVGYKNSYEGEGALFAVNRNGFLVWKVELNRTTQPLGQERGIYSPSIAVDGNMYCLGSDLHSMSQDGELRWSSGIPSGPSPYVITHGENILLFTTPLVEYRGTVLIKLNNEGERLWNHTFPFDDYEIEYSGWRPALGHDGVIYLGTTRKEMKDEDSWGYLYAIYEGEELWKTETSSGVLDVVLGDDENIYVGCDDGELYSFDKNGVEQWTYHTDSITSLSLGTDDTIYCTTENGSFIALDTAGRENWILNFSTEVSHLWSLAVGSEGTVYAGSWHEESEHAELYAVSSDGTVLWNYTLDSMPVGGAIGSDGTLYVLSKEGVLYAFGGEKPEEKDEYWQTFLIVGIVIIGALLAVYLFFKYRRRTQQHSNESRKRGELRSGKRV